MVSFATLYPALRIIPETTRPITPSTGRVVNRPAMTESSVTVVAITSEMLSAAVAASEAD